MIDQFRKFLSVPEFVSRAFAALEALSKDEYLMRPGLLKKLIEEVVPLAALLQHWWIPGRHLQCRFIGTDRGHDAEIRVSGPDVDLGFLDPLYHVEITTAVLQADYLVREALTNEFPVFGGYDIRRVKEAGPDAGKIVDHAVAVDPATIADETAEWIKAALAKKAAKEYASPCILVVNTIPRRPLLQLDDWARIQREVRDVVDRERFKLRSWSTGSGTWSSTCRPWAAFEGVA